MNCFTTHEGENLSLLRGKASFDSIASHVQSPLFAFTKSFSPLRPPPVLSNARPQMSYSCVFTRYCQKQSTLSEKRRRKETLNRKRNECGDGFSAEWAQQDRFPLSAEMEVNWPN